MTWYPTGALIFFILLLIYLLAGRRWRDGRSSVMWFATLAVFVAFLLTLAQGWFLTAFVAGVVLVVLAKYTFFDRGRRRP